MSELGMILRIMLIIAFFYVILRRMHGKPLIGNNEMVAFQSTQTASAVAYGPIRIRANAKDKDAEYHHELLNKKDITDSQILEALAFISDAKNIQ